MSCPALVFRRRLRCCAGEAHVLGALLVFAALGGGLASAASPSEVLLPPQQLPLEFSHRRHLRIKLACDFCHEQAETSISAGDRLLPGEKVCRTCHAVARAGLPPPGKQPMPCQRCHRFPPAPRTTDAGVALAEPIPLAVEIPPPKLRFNHKAHASRGISCRRCHAAVDQADLATRDHLPRMAACLECHNAAVPKSSAGALARAQRAAVRCQTCHLTRSDGKLETSLAGGRLVPSGSWKGDAHTADFARDHRIVGAQEEAYCLSCHRREECLSCHNGVVRPLSLHGNDYLSIHGIEARKATLDCNACHRRQSSCLACHERAGVVDRATSDGPNNLTRAGKRLHPPYERWVAVPKTPEHHAWQAERNLRSCVSCHREDTCLQCHSSRRQGGEVFHVSPHPAGFASSRACQALAGRNGRVCLKCHTPRDPHLNCQ